MFSRLLRPARPLRRLFLCPSSSPLSRTPPPPRSSFPISRLALTFLPLSRTFSSDRANGGDGNGTWKLTPDADEGDSIFGEDGAGLSGITDGAGADDSPGSGARWTQEPASEEKRDIFEGLDQEFGVEGGNGGEDVWETAEGYKPWTLGDDDDKGDVFGIAEEGGEGLQGIEGGGFDDLETEKIEEQLQLEKEKLEELVKQEKELLGVLKGPDRAFGDLIAASGITEDMIDSLILLKDVRGVKGLPPLSEIEDKAIARMNRTSSRAEIERKKQEEIASTRVRQVDEKGRAYGTGRRKCSVARVWIQPGDGKFLVNDKQFDAYFPIIDHRADLLRPFTVTNTLGLWDINCTVKGGGVSGQVGAIRLGISRALQNWEPGLRPYLKAAGYVTRDPRVVERKKPGKAKARKSFQWVKR